MPVSFSVLSRHFLRLHYGKYNILGARAPNTKSEKKRKKVKTASQAHCKHSRHPVSVFQTSPVARGNSPCCVVNWVGVDRRPWSRMSRCQALAKQKKNFYRLFLNISVGKHPLFLFGNEQTTCNLEFRRRKTCAKACRPCGTAKLVFGPVGQ